MFVMQIFMGAHSETFQVALGHFIYRGLDVNSLRFFYILMQDPLLFLKPVLYQLICDFTNIFLFTCLIFAGLDCNFCKSRGPACCFLPICTQYPESSLVQNSISMIFVQWLNNKVSRNIQVLLSPRNLPSSHVFPQEKFYLKQCQALCKSVNPLCSQIDCSLPGLLSMEFSE